MKKILSISIIIVVCACACSSSRKAHGILQTNDVRQVERKEYTVDSLAKLSVAETLSLTIDNAEIVIESIAYDTNKLDSLGVAPVKEKKRTRISYVGTQKVEEVVTASTDSVSHKTDTIQINHISDVYMEEEKEKSSHPPWTNTVLLIVIVILGLIIIKFLR